MYPNLSAEMARAKIKKKQLADLLNLSQTSVYLKMRTTGFSMKEGIKIQESLFPDLDVKYLFMEETR